MSHRNAINLMAFNDIGGSKAKNLCLRVKVVERFLYILSNSNENIQILQIFFSCSFDEFSCKVDSKEGFIIMCTPGPHLMRIHLVRNSTSARFEKIPKYSLNSSFF